MRKNPKHRFGIVFFSTFLASFCVAQTRLGGTVVDTKGLPLTNANVLLLHVKDSSLVKGAVTAKNGAFAFDNIGVGKYLISASYTGLKATYTPVIQIAGNGNINADTLRLAAQEVTLKGVTVTAKKPMFEQRIDRMVINVESSITNAGSTALEVLMRSPGVSVNQQNNTIAMNGKDGVVVMLNGKISRMPITAVVQMLAGMNAANIQKIELITTPPANFDAEGNAGFINIVLKTNTQYGTNGSFSVTAGYGLTAGPVV